MIATSSDEPMGVGHRLSGRDHGFLHPGPTMTDLSEADSMDLLQNGFRLTKIINDDSLGDDARLTALAGREEIRDEIARRNEHQWLNRADD